MKFAIHVYEQHYRGLHEIESRAVYELEDVIEAEAIAHEMSLEVIEEYAIVMNDIETEVDEFCDYSPSSDEWWDAIEEAKEEAVAYEIYPLAVETDKNTEELSNEFYNYPDEFLNKYCK